MIQIPFFKFKCPENLIKEIFDDIDGENFKYVKNFQNERSHYQFKNTNVINWINICLHNVQNELWKDHTLDFKLTVIDCWINKSRRMQKHHRHRHPNSLFSGILYLSDHIKNSETVFYYDDPWHTLEKNNFLQLLEKNTKFEIEGKYSPNIGDMIIFPSNIEHDTKTNIDKHPRLTLAFNSFPSGKIGYEDQATLLNLDTSF